MGLRGVLHGTFGVLQGTLWESVGHNLWVLQGTFNVLQRTLVAFAFFVCLCLSGSFGTFVVLQDIQGPLGLLRLLGSLDIIGLLRDFWGSFGTLQGHLGSFGLSGPFWTSRVLWNFWGPSLLLGVLWDFEGPSKRCGSFGTLGVLRNCWGSLELSGS